MSKIYVKAIKAQAVIRCDRCASSWESEPYPPNHWGDEVAACAPAFASGWRIFAGKRGQHAYCPECGPTSPMHLIYGDDLQPHNEGKTT